MKRLLATLAAAFCLMGASTQAFAQETPTATDPAVEAAGKLPASLMLSMQVAYVCQGVQGVEIYEEVKDISYQITLKISEDQVASQKFIETVEASAATLCPDKQNCWREFLKMPTATVEEGRAKCEQVTEAALSETLALLKIVTGDNS